MKSKKINRRIALNKRSIANLSPKEQKNIAGGNSEATYCGCPTYTWYQCYTDPIYNTCWDTCTLPAPSMCCDTDNVSCEN